MNPMAWLGLGRCLLCLASAAALVAGYIAWADHIGNAREAKVRAQYQTQADNANVKRAAITQPIEQKDAAAQIHIRTVTQTIIKEIPIYVKTTDCPMPGGFRVLHDAAANGQLPDAAGIADAEPVPAQDVASTVAENYGVCQLNSERLSALQEWVRAQADAK